MSKTKTEFWFKITYFRPSGGFYASTVVKWPCRELADDPDGAYIIDVVAKLRGFRDTGGPDSLPGIGGEGWDGPIVIEQVTERGDKDAWEVVDDFDLYGDPHLLMPRK